MHSNQKSLQSSNQLTSIPVALAETASLSTAATHPPKQAPIAKQLTSR